MSKETKKGMVPMLRFPEFREAGEWNIALFGEMYSFIVTNSFSRDCLNYENGLVKNIHYGDIHTKFSTLFDIRKETVPFINSSQPIEKIKKESHCQEGDMIFADASEDLDDAGKSIEIVHLNNEKLISGLHTLHARQKSPNLVIGFGGYLFKSNSIRAQIKREAQGAKVLGLSASRLSNVTIYYPQNKKEQQKIAACLSSLDDLIAAQSQKVEALKTHKKGLMQQLFPAEGETAPRLRFAEFREAGEWEKVALEKTTHNIMVGIASAATHAYRKSGVILFRNQNIKEGYLDDKEILFIDEEYEKAHKNKRLKTGDLLIARTGYPGTACVVPKKYEGSQSFTTLIARPNNEFIDSAFLCLYINSEQGQAFFNSTKIGGGQQNVNAGSLSEMPVPLPSIPEQQKIAICLSSLDELITAQNQKLETLKTHKKGLMQQLFPNPNDEAI